MKNNIHGIEKSNYEANKAAKESIQKAFVSLLEEKSYDEISITEIVAKASVSRSTYYRNYKDKKDIINEMSYNFVKFLLVSLRNPSFQADIHSWYVYVFNYVKDNSLVISLLLKTKDIYLAYLFPALKSARYTEEEKYQITGFEYALAAILSEWVLNKFNVSVESMADLCCEALPSAPLLFKNWKKTN